MGNPVKGSKSYERKLKCTRERKAIQKGGPLRGGRAYIYIYIYGNTGLTGGVPKVQGAC